MPTEQNRDRRRNGCLGQPSEPRVADPLGEQEIEAYALRLRALREAGAMIPLVQIYSATRPMARPRCGHLPLRRLTQIAQTVRQVAGLNAEVF